MERGNEEGREGIVAGSSNKRRLGAARGAEKRRLRWGRRGRKIVWIRRRERGKGFSVDFDGEETSIVINCLEDSALRAFFDDFEVTEVEEVVHSEGRSDNDRIYFLLNILMNYRMLYPKFKYQLIGKALSPFKI